MRLIVKKNVFLPSDGEECPEESVNTGKRAGGDVIDSMNSGKISIVAQGAHQGIRFAHYAFEVQLAEVSSTHKLLEPGPEPFYTGLDWLT